MSLLGHALRDKLRRAGVLGFTGEATAVLVWTAVWAGVVTAALAAASVVVPAAMAWDWLSGRGRRPVRCDAACVSGAAPCEHHWGSS